MLFHFRKAELCFPSCGSTDCAFRFFEKHSCFLFFFGKHRLYFFLFSGSIAVFFPFLGSIAVFLPFQEAQHTSRGSIGYLSRRSTSSEKNIRKSRKAKNTNRKPNKTQKHVQKKPGIPRVRPTHDTWRRMGAPHRALTCLSN